MREQRKTQAKKYLKSKDIVACNSMLQSSFVNT